MDDGTRIERELSLLMGRLVGLAWPSDPEDFPEHHGLPVPTTAKSLRALIQEVNSSNLLSASINKTAIRCVTNDTVPPLVHGIIMEGGAGDSKFLHLKRVLANNSLYFKNAILCVGISTDFCSTFPDTLSIPRDDLITMGAKYVGLRLLSWKYFSVYLAGANKDNFCHPPIGFYGETLHHLRNIVGTIRGRGGNAEKRLPFLTLQTDGVEVMQCASFSKIAELAAKRSDLSREFGLTDMLTLNLFMDQRDDSAVKLISRRTIEMHRKHITGALTLYALPILFFL